MPLPSEFLDSVENAVKNTDRATFWPGGGAQIAGSFIENDALELHNLLLQVQQRVTAHEAAKFVYNPSVIRYVLAGNYVIGLKLLIRNKKLTLNQAEKSLDFFIELLGEKMADDPFCVAGRNYWFSKKQTEEILQKKKFEVATESAARVVSKAIIALNSLVWSLYYDIYIAAGCEFHGPYDVNYKNQKFQLVIRDYFDLKPFDIWPDIQDYPFRSVTLYLLYSKTDIAVDFYMHDTSSKPLRPNLKFFYAEARDSNQKTVQIKPRELNRLIQTTIGFVDRQTKKINEMSIPEKILSGANICYYQLKDLKTAFNCDWHPTPETIFQIKKRGITVWNKYVQKNDDIHDSTDWKERYDLTKPL